MLSSHPQLALFPANAPAASKTPPPQIRQLWVRETAFVRGYKGEAAEETHLRHKASNLSRALRIATIPAVVARHMSRHQNPGPAAQEILITTPGRPIPMVRRLDHVQVVSHRGREGRDNPPFYVNPKLSGLLFRGASVLLNTV